MFLMLYYNSMRRERRNYSFSGRESSNDVENRFLKKEREKMNTLMTGIVEHYKDIGIQLERDGRVSVSAFRAFYPHEKLNEDRKYVEKKERYIKDRSIDTDKRNNIESECFEQLVSVIFTKVMPERFAVLRTAKYDDYEHGVDTIIIDRETGDVVCSVDEVISDNLEDATRKKMNHIEHMNENGVQIDYGYKKNEDGLFVPARYYADSPLCFLPIQRDLIPKIIESTSESITEVSRSDRAVFNHFIRFLRMSLSVLAKGHQERLSSLQDLDEYVARVARETEERLQSRIENMLEFVSSIQR